MIDTIQLEESSIYNREYDTYGDIYYGLNKALTARDNIRLKKRLTKQQIYKVTHPSTWDILLAITYNDDKKFGGDSYKIRYVIVYPEDEGLKDIAVIPLFGNHEGTTKDTFWCTSMDKPNKDEKNYLCEYLYGEKLTMGIGVINNSVINGAEVYRINREFLVAQMGVLDSNNIWKIRKVETNADIEKAYKDNDYL